MAIYLITGKPGSYKTASFIETALDEIKKGRLVYFCNVRGLKKEKYDLNTIDHFNEWEQVPEGAAIFIDEVQEFTRDISTTAKTEDLPSWFTKLEKHRHMGYDFYITTQHPMFIHPHIRRLLEKHTHMQRSGGMPFSNKRQWHQVCNEPENLDNASIKKGCTTTIYRPNKKVFDYYESTVNDTHKFKIDKKFFTYGIPILALIGFAFYMGYPVAQRYLNFSDKPQAAQVQNASTVPASNAPLSPQIQAEQGTLAAQAELDKKIAACVDQMGLSFEMCQDLYKPELRNEQLLAENQNDLDSLVFKYHADNPYAVIDVSSSYEVTAKPQFSGCIKYDGKYYGYTQQGTKLQVSQSDCQRLIDQGDRPFNYFAKETSRLEKQEQPQQKTQTIDDLLKTDPEFLTKYIEAKKQGLI